MDKPAKVHRLRYEGTGFISKIPVRADFEISVRGADESIKCHSVILCMSVPFFEDLSQFVDGKYSLELDVSASVVLEFVQSMYSGTLEVTRENARDLMLLAHFWRYNDAQLITKLGAHLHLIEKHVPEVHPLRILERTEPEFGCGRKKYANTSIAEISQRQHYYVLQFIFEGVQHELRFYELLDFNLMFLGRGIIWDSSLFNVSCFDMLTREDTRVNLASVSIIATFENMALVTRAKQTMLLEYARISGNNNSTSNIISVATLEEKYQILAQHCEHVYMMDSLNTVSLFNFKTHQMRKVTTQVNKNMCSTSYDQGRPHVFACFNAGTGSMFDLEGNFIRRLPSELKTTTHEYPKCIFK